MLRDSQGMRYNIEIQRADKGAGAKRARYNSSLIDSNILPAGFEVENLAEPMSIFITENDAIAGINPFIILTDILRDGRNLWRWFPYHI